MSKIPYFIVKLNSALPKNPFPYRILCENSIYKYLIVSKNLIQTVLNVIRCIILYGTQDNLRNQSKQCLLNNLGQAILHVIVNSFLTLLNINRAINLKQH